VGAHVYELRDPRNGAVRYVGVSANLATRLIGHVSVGRRCAGPNTAFHAWIADLLVLGLRPQIVPVEAVDDDRVSRREAEDRWIRKHVRRGAHLVNGRREIETAFRAAHLARVRSAS